MMKQNEKDNLDNCQDQIIKLIQLQHLENDQIQSMVSNSPFHYLIILYQQLTILHSQKTAIQKDKHAQEMQTMQHLIDQARQGMMFVVEENDNLKLQIDELKIQSNQINVKIQQLQSQLQSLTHQTQQYKQSNKKLKQQFQSIQSQNNNLSLQINLFQHKNNKIQQQNKNLLYQNLNLKIQYKDIQQKYQIMVQESTLKIQKLRQYQKLYQLEQQKVYSFIQHYNRNIQDGHFSAQEEEQEKYHHSVVQEYQYKSLNVDHLTPVAQQSAIFDHLEEQYGRMIKQQLMDKQQPQIQLQLRQTSLLRNQEEICRDNDDQDRQNQFYRQCKLSCIDSYKKNQHSQFQQQYFLLQTSPLPKFNSNANKQKCQTERQMMLTHHHYDLNRQQQKYKKLTLCSNLSLPIQPQRIVQNKIRSNQNFNSRFTINHIISYQLRPLKQYKCKFYIKNNLQLSYCPYYKYSDPKSLHQQSQTNNMPQRQSQPVIKTELLSTQQDNNPENFIQTTTHPTSYNQIHHPTSQNKIPQQNLNIHHQSSLPFITIRQCLQQSSFADHSSQLNQINQPNYSLKYNQINSKNNNILPLSYTNQDNIQNNNQNNMNHIILPKQIILPQQIINYQTIPQIISSLLKSYHYLFIKFINKYHLSLEFIDNITKQNFTKPKEIKNKLYVFFVRKDLQQTIFIMNQYRLYNMKKRQYIKLQYNNNCIDRNNFKFGQSEIIVSSNGHIIINRSNKRKVLKGRIEDGDWVIDSYIDFKANPRL